MLKKLKKFIVIALLVSLLIPLTAQPARAFYTPNISYQFQFFNAVFHTDEMNLQSFVYETLKAVAGSIVTVITGCWTCPPGQATFGAIGVVNQFIAMIYTNPPASGVQYLAYLGNKLDLVPETYAQGTSGEGFARMQALLPVWQAFRNISYAFFVVILIFIGFGIMFRVKVSPQAVMTMQAALPRIIISLALITFSYAIVGLLLDLTLVLGNLVISVFWNIPGLPDFMREALPSGPITDAWGLGKTIFQIGGKPVGGVLKLVFVALLLPNVILGWFTAGTTVAASMFVMGLLVIIFLVALVKVFWALLKAYIGVIMSLIFAPFQLLIGALPGVPATSAWFKNLLANLAVFPVILTMILLAGYLSGASVFGLGLTQTVSAFVLGNAPEDPAAVINQLSQNLEAQAGTELGSTEIGNMFMLFLVSLGVLLMAPKAADMIKAFMAGKPFGAGAALGEAMTPMPVRSAQAGIERTMGGTAAGHYQKIKAIPGAVGKRVINRIPLFKT